jgi:four helix bundle protein
VHDFRRLLVWQKSRVLVRNVYELTRPFPNTERFGLTQQTRSAATSIAANIAEGCGRYGGKEFARFLSVSLGSAFELESHLELARDLGFANPQEVESLLKDCSEVRRMLVAFSKSLNQR